MITLLFSVFFLENYDWLEKTNSIELLTGEEHPIGYPLVLDCDNEGNLFLLDHKERSVFKISRSGEILFSFGRDGYGPGEFIYPLDISIDRQRGKVWVADFLGQRIACFDTDGRLLIHKNVGFEVCSLVARKDGKIVAGGLGKENLRLFDENLNVLRVFGQKLVEDKAKNFDRKYMHMEVDEQNRLYVAYAVSPLIERYDENCELLWRKERRWVNDEVKQQRTRFSEQKGRITGSAHHDNIFFYKGRVYLFARAEEAVIILDPDTGSYIAHKNLDYLIRGICRFEETLFTCSGRGVASIKSHLASAGVMNRFSLSPLFEKRQMISKDAVICIRPVLVTSTEDNIDHDSEKGSATIKSKH